MTPMQRLELLAETEWKANDLEAWRHAKAAMHGASMVLDGEAEEAANFLRTLAYFRIRMEIA